MLSSTPELPQDEILARFLFKRSVSDLSVVQIAQLPRGAFYGVDAPFQKIAGIARAFPQPHRKPVFLQALHLQPQKVRCCAQPTPAPKGVGQHQSHQGCSGGKLQTDPPCQGHAEQNGGCGQSSAGEQRYKRAQQQQRH